MIVGVNWGWWGFGEVTAPPLCNLTQMTLMQVVHTETYLHRWEPLREPLLIKRAVIWLNLGFRLLGLRALFWRGGGLGEVKMKEKF